MQDAEEVERDGPEGLIGMVRIGDGCFEEGVESWEPELSEIFFLKAGNVLQSWDPELF